MMCGRTVSVLPACFLPYRPVPTDRVQAYFDNKAGIGSGPDPPPSQKEAGCLKRAWSRLSARLAPLRQLCGQLLPASMPSREHLWMEMRRAMGSLQEILQWLARTRNTSLLGDYACLKPAPDS
jgi:hypothetical protein